MDNASAPAPRQIFLLELKQAEVEKINRLTTRMSGVDRTI